MAILAPFPSKKNHLLDIFIIIFIVQYLHALLFANYLFNVFRKIIYGILQEKELFSWILFFFYIFLKNIVACVLSAFSCVQINISVTVEIFKLL